ncbi:MAG TPA: T9SS type A sorting domain-containing protein [Melioribacteraceae bacterium]|nr:T9SS type A sorting domain-containing protein [Melioribacteraceae bacterium]
MKTLILFFLLAIFSEVINAQVIVIKTEFYGGLFSDIPTSTIKLRDNNYLIAGYTYTQNEFNSDILIIKIDEYGNIIWDKTFGTLGFDCCNAVVEDENGNLFLSGYSNFNGSKDIFLIKTDNYGNVIWEKYFEEEGIQNSTGLCIVQNKIYLNGYTNNITAGDYDLYLTCLDFSGNILWQKKIGGSGSELSANIIGQNDYIISAGSTGSFNAVNRDMLAIKLDLQGNIVWQKNFNRNNFDSAGKITTTKDGGYAFIGSSDKHGSDFMDMSLFRMNYNGVKKWAVYKEAYNNYDYGTDILELENGSFLAVGNSKKDNYNNDILIVYIDSLGTTKWNYIIDMGKNEWVNNIIRINENKFMLIGYTNSKDNYIDDIFITYFETNTTNVNGESYLPKDYLYNNYPNPFNPSTTINYSIAEASEVKLRIFDVTGQIVKELVNEYKNSGFYSVFWEGKNDRGDFVASGVYYCLLTAGNRSFINKLALIK